MRVLNIANIDRYSGLLPLEVIFLEGYRICSFIFAYGY